ncbi:transposase [Candidatus Palauibacter sp.]|uniref:transposase n=1 Tax=Candidatus Palauibacter sp. TaxID=3101350 RepID=UPI003B52DC2E
MLFRTRDLLVRQRTQTINALRGHLAEYGVVAPQGRVRIRQLVGEIEAGDCGLPGAVVELGWLLLRQIDGLDEKIDGLGRELRKSAGADEETARLMTIPGIGPSTALAIQAFAPPMESFRRGRDFSAWLGLVPRQHTTGGKPRLGRISKMGQRDLTKATLDHGSHGGFPPRESTRRGIGPIAGQDVGTQAQDAGSGGVGQHDGTGRLGADHEEGDLPGSRRRLTGQRKERSSGEMMWAGRTNG